MIDSKQTALTSLMAILFSVSVFFGLSLVDSTAYAADEPTKAGQKVERFKLSARDKEILGFVDAQEKFMKLLAAPGILTEEVLDQVDFEVRDLAFYRFNDRQYKNFPRVFYDSIEQQLIDKFLAAKRFFVHECFECKTTRVLLKEKQFSVLRQLDSNEALADIGKKISVDSFVLWEAYMYKGEPVLSIRIVSSENGQVRWSRQYQSELDYEFEWELYTSFWGLSADRTSVSSEPNASISPIINVGLKTLTRSTIMHRLYYGYGFEVFANTMDRGIVNVFGMGLSGRAAMEIDNMLGLEAKNYGNWLIYGSIGQAFIKNLPSVLLRGGLEIRLNRRNFIEIGGVYLPRKDVGSLPTNSNYNTTASFGGIGYDVTIGFRF